MQLETVDGNKLETDWQENVNLKHYCETCQKYSDTFADFQEICDGHLGRMNILLTIASNWLHRE